jgi:hypothetical protein
MKYSENRKTNPYIIKARIITCLVLVALVGINILTSFLYSKYPNLKIDISPSKLYNVSDEARDYLNTVDQDIKIMAMTQDEEIDPEIQKLHHIVARMALVNKRFSFEVVNVTKNISFLEKYNRDNNLSIASIIIDNGASFRVVNPQVDYEAQKIDYSDFESKMVNGINGLASQNGKKIVFLSGHKEVKLAGAKSLLLEGNYVLSDIDLVKDAIADDISTVILANPQEDFLPLEIAKMEKYATKGGCFQLFLDPVKNLPNLNSFISKWGIDTKTDSVAVEGGKENLLDKALAKLEIVQNTYTQKLKSNEIIYASVFYYKPLKIINPNVTIILNTSANAYSKPSATDNITKTSKDKESVFAISAIAQGLFESNKNSKMFVSGSTLFLEQTEMLSRSGNLNLYSAIISDMTGGSNVISIKNKVSNPEVLILNQNQANVVLLIFIIIIPMLVLIVGVVIILRRKNR